MKTKMLAAVFAIAAFAPAPAPAASSALCDGIAPQTVSCEVEFRVETDTPQPAPSMEGFMGTVTATITTDTGSVSMGCSIGPRDFLSNPYPTAKCGVPKFQGVIVKGQHATLTGHVSGTLVPGTPGIGPWQVAANG